MSNAACRDFRNACQHGNLIVVNLSLNPLNLCRWISIDLQAGLLFRALYFGSIARCRFTYHHG
jgi:hypothetical protein